MIVTNIVIIGQKMAFAMWINTSKLKLVFDNTQCSELYDVHMGTMQKPNSTFKKAESPHRVKVTSLNTPLHSQF